MTINHTFQFWCAVTAEHIRTRLTWIQRDTKATWYLMYILHFIRWFTPSFNFRTVQVVGSVVKSERHRPKSQEQVDLLRLALNSSRGKGLTQWCNCKAQKEKKTKNFPSLFSHPRLGFFHPVWGHDDQRKRESRPTESAHPFHRLRKHTYYCFSLILSMCVFGSIPIFTLGFP